MQLPGKTARPNPVQHFGRKNSLKPRFPVSSKNIFRGEGEKKSTMETVVVIRYSFNKMYISLQVEHFFMITRNPRSQQECKT